MSRGPKPLTTAAFIAKARARRGNRFDYSKVDYVNANTRVTIVCPEHGDFQQTPGCHIRGDNCPKCGRASSSAKLTGAKHPGVGRPRADFGGNNRPGPNFGPLLEAWK